MRPLDPNYSSLASYSIHWTFWGLPRPASDYAHGVNRTWITSDLGGAVLKGVTCDYLHDVLTMSVEVVADDLPRALEWGRMLVFGLMERSQLELPSSTSMVASSRDRPSETPEEALA